MAFGAKLECVESKQEGEGFMRCTLYGSDGGPTVFEGMTRATVRNSDLRDRDIRNFTAHVEPDLGLMLAFDLGPLEKKMECRAMRSNKNHLLCEVPKISH